jgi:hypothetical protein
LVAKIENFFGRNSSLSRAATEIGMVSKINPETVELIIRATLEFSYNNYKVDMERLNKDNSNLRRELRSTQQKSRANTFSITKKEGELKAKE